MKRYQARYTYNGRTYWLMLNATDNWNAREEAKKLGKWWNLQEVREFKKVRIRRNGWNSYGVV